MRSHKFSSLLRSLSALLLVFGLLTGCTDMGDPFSPDGNNTPPDNPTWVADIWPSIIQPDCSGCHGPVTANAGLNFSEFNEWINEDSGSGNPYVVPGDPANSELIWRLEGDGVERMPLGRELQPEEIEFVSLWIEQGAKYE